MPCQLVIVDAIFEAALLLSTDGIRRHPRIAPLILNGPSVACRHSRSALGKTHRTAGITGRATRKASFADPFRKP